MMTRASFRTSSRTPLRASLALATLVVAAAGCSDATFSASPVTELPDDVELTATAAPDVIEAGTESVTITVQITNTGDRTLALTFATDCPVVFGVTDETGTVVHPDGGAWPCREIPTQIVLQPGLAFTDDLEWDGTALDGTIFEPGDYNVFGALTAELTFRSTLIPLELR